MARVLIASKRMPDTEGRRNGGVQTWVKTVASALRLQGHDVHIADAVVRPSEDDYDIGIFANQSFTADYFRLCRKMVIVSHGILEAENPHSKHAVATSHEVARKWCLRRVIGQPIDIHNYCPTEAEKLGYVFRYSWRGGLPFLPEASEPMGFISGRYFNDMAITHIRNSSCVLASGRSMLEAMSCGVPVVCVDNREYMGAMINTDMESCAWHNYSGRGGVVPTTRNVRIAIQNSMDSDFNWRQYVVDNHDYRVIAEKLLDAAC